MKQKMKVGIEIDYFRSNLNLIIVNKIKLFSSLFWSMMKKQKEKKKKSKENIIS
jgi:hypothetical protein